MGVQHLGQGKDYGAWGTCPHATCGQGGVGGCIGKSPQDGAMEQTHNHSWFVWVAVVEAGPATPRSLDLDCWEGGEKHKEWLQEHARQDGLCTPKNCATRATALLLFPRHATAYKQ